MKNFSDLSCDELFEGPPPLTTATEAHEKLKRNLDQALDWHSAAMAGELPDLPAGDKRLGQESANMTVKAALTTDRTALKARSEGIAERLALRTLFHRKRLGRELSPAEEAELRSTPRKKMEAAMGDGPGAPRLMAEFDKMMEG